VTRRRLDPRVLGALAALAAVGVALVVAGGGDDRGGDGGGTARSSTTTTLATGGLDLRVPEGWQPVPLPSLGFGLAVPPGWQVTRTDEATLDALGDRSIDSPGFVDSARNAAASGAVLYAAHQDDAGRVSDLKVLVLPRPGATSAAELRELADGLVVEAELSGARVTESTVDGEPVVTIRYEVAGGEVAAVGTQVLRAGDRAVVSLIVTSEDPASHDDLAADLAATLVLG
jgi:hypothetical protein